MRFVIIEDEVRIREGITTLLTRMNKNFLIIGEAENGEEGLKLIEETNPDVVITDIRMPIMDGLEMLREAYKGGRKMKSIVLSAYSEFDYARQAIKLGVTEYLLKPVVLTEFHQAIARVTAQIELDHMQKPRQLGTLVQVIEGLFNKSIIADKELCFFLQKKFHITEETPLAIICFYLGTMQEGQGERIQSNLITLFQQKKELSYCIIPTLHKKSLIVMVYGYQNGHSLERWIQYQILNRLDKQMQVGIGWMEIQGVSKIKTAFDELYPYLDWNIVLGEDVLISYPKITKIQTVPCIYPVKLENKLKLAICTNQQDHIKQCIEKFHLYFQSGQVYAPKEIKECYVRFLWAFLNTSNEVGNGTEKKIEQQKMLEQIMGAKTRKELRLVTEELSQCILLKDEEQEITHLTIKRVVNMIHEFYSSGITLEEIADKLNITPEYLGTQFSKEMGMHFSTYMKNFRMAKAKELLIGTSMKQYEIAIQVGYTDPKYFSKVFKARYGQLPAEYRKTHK